MRARSGARTPAAPAVPATAAPARRGDPTKREFVAPAPRLHTIAETMAMLRLGRSSIYRLVGAGRLELINLTGDSARITAESVDALVASARRTIIAPRPDLSELDSARAEVREIMFDAES